MNSKITKYMVYQLPWQLLMLAIFIQSSIGQIDLPDLGIEWSDKLIHFVVFGILGWLVARGFNHAVKSEYRRRYLTAALLLSSLFAASDEIHQYWVPGRNSDILDFLADVLGILVFVWLYHLWQKSRKKQETSVTEAAESNV